MDFSTFVLSLGRSAVINLGNLPHPGDDAVDVNLPAAKQIIDILEVLQEKTEGNLDADENKLLTSLITDLRLKYVEAKSKSDRGTDEGSDAT